MWSIFFAEQQNFERLKNREDGSDFDDFLTESIASAVFFPAPSEKICVGEKFSCRRYHRRCRCRRRLCPVAISPLNFDVLIPKGAVTYVRTYVRAYIRTYMRMYVRM